MSNDRQTLQAAHQLLSQLGITPEDLLRTSDAANVPTFREFIQQVQEAVSPATVRAYRPYWNRVEECWGDRAITEPTALEIRKLSETYRRTTVARRNSRNGRGATENLIAAIRCIYKHAQDDGFIKPADNPAARVPKPRRLPSTRRAIPDRQLSEIIRVASTTGNDPDLDALLIRFHIETACRRGGALGLRLQDLDDENYCVQLREKDDTVRWQPISRSLLRAIRDHTATRAPADVTGADQVFRYQNGHPITGRRYDHLWERIGSHLPWVAGEGITAHWLRHTTLTWVERNFGYAVAHAYAGHTDNTTQTGATTTYIRASLEEVAQAVAALTGEPHPLCLQADNVSSDSLR
ncbi:tyrosine-type recombinase/integrase [Nocardia uniformis]|uniref:Tyrosine-type recombinase/integrase n=1 Tax=Nocardia uniformis TaxID=53432 RepID=A0A849CIF2_9NOCA|nr:tyrosine-type recombinase/integrase [Nocardia uniformis]NNH76079.1 tyrosine-type recombinase/integrase [Nocardia uniformis]